MSLIAAAPAATRRARDLGLERVGADRDAGPLDEAGHAGIRRSTSSAAATGGPERAATAPTSSISKPAATSAIPSAIACSAVPLRAPSYIESTVTLTIPAPIGRTSRSSVRSARRQARHWSAI